MLDPIRDPALDEETSLVFRAGPQFLPSDADRIHAAIQRLPPGAAIELDFRGVRECHATALSQLARDLQDGRVSLRFRGLTDRQWRMLRYLGVSDAAIGAIEALGTP